MLVRDPELLGLRLQGQDKDICHEIGRSAELLIDSIFEQRGIETHLTGHTCPIDMIVPLNGKRPLGIEIKASFTDFHRIHLKHDPDLRKLKTDYCREMGYQPYLILVQYIQMGEYFYLTYKKGIKRFEKKRMHSLYDLIEMIQRDQNG